MSHVELGEPLSIHEVAAMIGSSRLGREECVAPPWASLSQVRTGRQADLLPQSSGGVDPRSTEKGGAQP